MEFILGKYNLPHMESFVFLQYATIKYQLPTLPVNTEMTAWCGSS